MKKLLLFTFLFVFAFNAMCFAAVSGSKSAPRPAAPAAKPPTTQTTPAPSTDYKPSAPANSYSNTAPAATTAMPQAPQQPASGGFMRNLGMLGGGMLLGGLLGNMFGFGNSGMFATLAGLLFNVIVVVGIFMAGRFLWNRYKKGREQPNRRN